MSVIVGLWLAAVGVGAAKLMRYASTPGFAARPPARWPHTCPLKLSERGLTLVVSLHPKCPCSRATVGELARLVTQSGNGLTVYALLVVPPGAPDGWERGAIYDAASAIPGVTLVRDSDGDIAGQFGAATSGHACAFAADGRQLFSGGLTAARGHMGDSAGGDALRAMLSGREPAQSRTDVFGCPLGLTTRAANGEGDGGDEQR